MCVEEKDDLQIHSRRPLLLLSDRCVYMISLVIHVYLHH